MGPSQASQTQQETAYALGRAIATEGWLLLTGGRQEGVMDAACRGAKSAHGLTVGILPTATPEGISSAVDVPILTDLGCARNNVNVLSSQVVVACGVGPGTVSEVALAIKANRPVILLAVHQSVWSFFQGLSDQPVAYAETVEETIQSIHKALGNQ